MREIYFRGKSVDNGEWVYGYYWTNEVGNHFIRKTIDSKGCLTKLTIEDIEVEEETIGQFTGIYDSNNVPIYEGDKINIYDWGRNSSKLLHTGFVYFNEEEMQYQINSYIDIEQDDLWVKAKKEIIGNIYDEKNE